MGMTNLMIVESKFKFNAITAHVLCKEGKFVVYVNKELCIRRKRLIRRPKMRWNDQRLQ